MEIQDVIDTQYKIMAMMDELGLSNDSATFKYFKERTLENLNFLIKIRDELDRK